jgi:hypothetical protein
VTSTPAEEVALMDPTVGPIEIDFGLLGGVFALAPLAPLLYAVVLLGRPDRLNLATLRRLESDGDAGG